MAKVPTSLVTAAQRVPQAEPVFAHYRETLEVVRVARLLDEALCACPAALQEERLTWEAFIAGVRAIREAAQALRHQCETLVSKTKVL